MLYTMSCIYPSHFNCMGAESVVSFPDYEPHGTGSTKRLTCEKEHARAEMQQGPRFHPTLVVVLSYFRYGYCCLHVSSKVDNIKTNQFRSISLILSPVPKLKPGNNAKHFVALQHV